MKMKKILSVLKNKKGASFIELILIIGALALITVFGMIMFRQQSNSTGKDFQENVKNSEEHLNTQLNTNGSFDFKNNRP